MTVLQAHAEQLQLKLSRSSLVVAFLSWHRTGKHETGRAKTLEVMLRAGTPFPPPSEATRMRMGQMTEAVSEWRAAAVSGDLQMVWNTPYRCLTIMCAVAAKTGAFRAKGV